MSEPFFVDLGFSQCRKHGEDICGDAFKFIKNMEDSRVVAVLSDGLGSGVKANILASMTATMALKFANELTGPRGILHAAEIMMDALPICQVRKISYATFTILNAWPDGNVRIIEMGNPAFVLLRNDKVLPVPYDELNPSKYDNRSMRVYHFKVDIWDRIVFFSDGVTQAAIGSDELPLGWRESGVSEYLVDYLNNCPDASSYEVAEHVIGEAISKEPHNINKDDMTCAALYFRNPREMLLFTGPPYDSARDAECASFLKNFVGDKAICGGTSAEIVSRELGRELKMDLSSISPDMPPMSTMDGVNLVTEGIFTLSKAATYLEESNGVRHNDPAGLLTGLMLRNDVITFLVGTRINEAHQDPNLPHDLELRRNIVQRLARTLENQYLKKVVIKYV
ncbi:MAG: SpoIIE family protein phosphatase [Lentisphaeria bacterium]|nr:SpoIIE family protein phosphatase [Lentisphaeria bacterium]